MKETHVMPHPLVEIEEAKFADGTVWTRDTLAAQMMMATEQDHQLWGTYMADAIEALGGNGTINGGSNYHVAGNGTRWRCRAANDEELRVAA